MYNTRYTLISDSTTQDNNGAFYPDIITFPIENFRYSAPPIPFRLRDIDIERFDLLVSKYYGTLAYMDLILWLNDISYISRKQPGDEIYLPLKSDLDAFYVENL